jgi:AbrB family looped-hinge helix DNA binding protein
MKAAPPVSVRVSSKGQIAIPKSVRQSLGIHQGADLRVTVEGDMVVLRKISQEPWRKWEGAFKDVPLLDDLASERRKELSHDVRKGS